MRAVEGYAVAKTEELSDAPCGISRGRRPCRLEIVRDRIETYTTSSSGYAHGFGVIAKSRGVCHSTQVSTSVPFAAAAQSAQLA